MRTIDLREEEDEVTTIIFSNQHDCNDYRMAYELTVCDNRIVITDGTESVFVDSASHARYLIKALEKAIELKMLT